MNRPYNKSVNGPGNDLVVAAKRNWLYHLTVYNGSGNTIYPQLFDSATNTPSGQPDFEVSVPPGGTVAFPFHKDGYPMGLGIYVRPVTTPFGSTVVSGNPAKITALYDIDALT